MNTPNHPPKVTYSVNDVCKMTGLCRQSIYNQINSGHLRSFKVGKRRFISPTALDEWIALHESGAAA